jgi:hypothetical protein
VVATPMVKRQSDKIVVLTNCFCIFIIRVTPCDEYLPLNKRRVPNPGSACLPYSGVTFPYQI